MISISVAERESCNLKRLTVSDLFSQSSISLTPTPLRSSPPKRSLRLTLRFTFVNLSTSRCVVVISRAAAVLYELPCSHNPASHFCPLYRYVQAGGNQVRSNAEEVSATIVTRVIKSGDNSTDDDYQCFIMVTNRSYDSENGDDLLKQGLFIFEVSVEQIVHVTSEGSQLSLDQVAAIVTTGFNRGQGGRAKFRSLLRNHPVFASIENVEVLSNLSLPQEFPTPSPSIFATPSTWPSFPPSLAPNNAPTVASSSAPTSLSSGEPTTVPSGKPIEIPTVNPTVTMSMAPLANPAPVSMTTRPSNGGNVSPIAASEDSRQRKRQPLIFGAIAVGAATILVSLFFIACVWYPFCVGRKDNAAQQDSGAEIDRDRMHRPVPSSHSSASSSRATVAMVPALLTLDEDSRSLANTTVTLGEKSSVDGFKICRTVRPTSPVIPEPIRRAESFDESSIYTSTDASTGVEGDVFQSTPSLQVVSTSPVADKSGDVDDDPPVAVSQPDAFLLEQQVELAEGVSLEKQEAFGLGTKGFDPFDNEEDDGDDESSFGFGSSVALSDPSFGTPTKARVAKVSPSSTSTKTERIENLHSGVAPDPAFATDGSVDKKGDARRWASLFADSDGDDDLSQISHGASTDRSSNVARPNDTLLRNLLEGASRDIAERNSSSSKSRASLQSAPSRILHRQAREGQRKTLAHGRPPPHFRHHLAESLDIAANLPMSSSRSVGERPRSRMHSKCKERSNVAPLKTWHRGQLVDSASPSKSDTTVEGVPPDLWQTPLPLGHRLHGNDSTLLISAASFDGTPTRGSVALGARSRQQLLESSMRAEYVTPPSSPGLLGIVSLPSGTSTMNDSSSDSGRSTPWLFETEERTLGARPRVGDGGSTSSSSRSEKSQLSANERTSDRSVGSTASVGSRRSRRSGRSGIDEIYRERTNSPQSRTSTPDPMTNGSRVDEQKSSDLSLAPRSLEHELMRLEMHHDNTARGLTTTSSVTESSAGASRSTLSSRVDTRMSEEERVIIVAPPGKIDVVLTNRHDGKGTFVSEVRPSSSLIDKLSPGDKLGKQQAAHSFNPTEPSDAACVSFLSVAIDGVDVTRFAVSKITAMMAGSATNARRQLTVVPSPRLRSFKAQESKQEGSP